MNGFNFLIFIGMVLSLVSLNARGLMGKRKFEMVNELCKEQDVIILQETNCKEEMIEDVEKRWKGQIFYNNGDGRMGRGVAILIRENVEINAYEVYNDKKGKCNGIKITQGDNEFVIINLHATTHEGEKRDFLRESGS